MHFPAEFGLKGDGTTDDAAALQTAIDTISAAGGGALVLEPKTYRINSTVALKSNVTLRGVGDLTVIALGANAVMLSIGAITNVTLENFKLDGRRATYTNTANTGIYGPAPGGASNIRLSAVTVQSVAGAGILLLASSGTHTTNVVIRNSVTDDTGAHGIITQDYVDQVTITNTRVSNFGMLYADRPGITVSRNGSDVIVTNNLVIGSPSALGTSVHGISLDGVTRATVANNTITGTIGYGIEITGAAAVLSRVAVTGNAIGPTQSRSCIVLDGANALVADNVAITGNTCKGSAAEGIYVFVGGTPAASHTNVTISDNVIDTPGTVGILLNSLVNFTVANNTIRNAVQSGIYLDATLGAGANKGVFSGNMLDGNNTSANASHAGMRLSYNATFREFTAIGNRVINSGNLNYLTIDAGSTVNSLSAGENWLVLDTLRNAGFTTLSNNTIRARGGGSAGPALGAAGVSLGASNLFIGAGNEVILAKDTSTTALQFGLDGNPPGDQVFKGADGSGTNIAGGNFTLAPGSGTGTANGGDLLLATNPAGGSSGTTINALVERARVPVDGGVRWATGSKPTCDSTHRGTVFYVAGAAGVADTYEVCRKDAANAYAWVTLF